MHVFGRWEEAWSTQREPIQKGPDEVVELNSRPSCCEANHSATKLSDYRKQIFNSPHV